MLHFTYLLAFTLTLQVFHIHLDEAEEHAEQCLMCIHQADDDVVMATSAVEQHVKHSFVALTPKISANHYRYTPQQARSPPATL